MALAFDTTTDHGARSLRRLETEQIAWLTTVDAGGTPQPVPVWFLLDGDSVLVYSKPGTPKLANIDRSGRVALHFDGNGTGGDIVVLTGRAARSDDPPADDIPAFVAKYADRIAANGWTPRSFAADYSVPLRITIGKLRGH